LVGPARREVRGWRAAGSDRREEFVEHRDDKKHRREAPHPPEQRDVIDLDAALSEELLEVPLRQGRTGETSGLQT